MGADAALVVRAGLQDADKGLLLLGIALSAVAVALAAAGWARHRQLRGPHSRSLQLPLTAFAGAGVLLAAGAVLWEVQR